MIMHKPGDLVSCLLHWRNGVRHADGLGIVICTLTNGTPSAGEEYYVLWAIEPQTSPAILALNFAWMEGELERWPPNR